MGLPITRDNWGGLPKYLPYDLQHVQNRSLDIVGIPKMSFPSLKERRIEAIKREMERIVNDIKYPNQIFLPKSSVRRSYNLRAKPSCLKIPCSGAQRHANLSLVKTAGLLDST